MRRGIGGLNDIATCARRMGQLEHARGMGAHWHALDSPTPREIQTRVIRGACLTASKQNWGHENVEKTGGKVPEVLVDAIEKSALHCIYR